MCRSIANAPSTGGRGTLRRPSVLAVLVSAVVSLPFLVSPAWGEGPVLLGTECACGERRVRASHLYDEDKIKVGGAQCEIECDSLFSGGSPQKCTGVYMLRGHGRGRGGHLEIRPSELAALRDKINEEIRKLNQEAERRRKEEIERLREDLAELEAGRDELRAERDQEKRELEQIGARIAQAEGGEGPLAVQTQDAFSSLGMFLECLYKRETDQERIEEQRQAIDEVNALGTQFREDCLEAISGFEEYISRKGVAPPDASDESMTACLDLYDAIQAGQERLQRALPARGCDEERASWKEENTLWTASLEEYQRAREEYFSQLATVAKLESDLAQAEAAADEAARRIEDLEGSPAGVCEERFDECDKFQTDLKGADSEGVLQLYETCAANERLMSVCPAAQAYCQEIDCFREQAFVVVMSPARAPGPLSELSPLLKTLPTMPDVQQLRKLPRDEMVITKDTAASYLALMEEACKLMNAMGLKNWQQSQKGAIDCVRRKAKQFEWATDIPGFSDPRKCP